MSFGDLEDTPVSTPSSISSSSSSSSTSSSATPSPTNGELHRLLKPLALNNAALRETTYQLSQQYENPSASTLKRMRALRDQNRQIASAAAALIADGEAFMSADEESRTQLKSLLEEFSTAVLNSANVERTILTNLQKQNISVASFLENSSNSSSLPSSPVNPSLSSNHHHNGMSYSNTNTSDTHNVLIDNNNKHSNSADPTSTSESSPLLLKNVANASIYNNNNNSNNSNGFQNENEHNMNSIGSQDESNGVVQLEQQQMQQTTYRTIDMNDGYMAERQAALTDIQSSVDDVNSIFKDLAVMVNDQRAQVDYVEVAMNDSVTHIELARRQLEKTRQRRNARKSLFFCTLFTIALIISIFLIILLS